MNNKVKLVLWGAAIVVCWGACFVTGSKFGQTLYDVYSDIN